MPILRAALYIRSVYRRKLPVDELKSDIRIKYGQRGANIANLCSAGYFESHLKPMYEELAASPNFTPELFLNTYNVIVAGAPFAVFVGRSRTLADLTAEVEEKLLINKDYGIKRMNIHAIGTSNVQTLQNLLKQKRIVQYLASEPAISSQRGVMNVEIFF